MSVIVMGLVWSTPPDLLPPNHRLVLLAYADHANDDGSSVYPGRDRMAEKTGYSKGTIGRITSQLLEAGWLRQTKHGHRGQRAEYRVNVTRLKGAQDARLSSEKGAQLDEERRAYGTEKARTGARPNHHEPSGEPSDLVFDSRKRKRDLLWEVFCEIHGDPATDSERGKFNAIVGKLREAGVTPGEYQVLVRAYVSKHRGSQPTAATVAERVGEMRHYAARGPMKAPTPEQLEQEQKWLEAMVEHEAIEEGDHDGE